MHINKQKAHTHMKISNRS